MPFLQNSSKGKPNAQYYSLLDQFYESFFIGRKFDYSYQYKYNNGKLAYHPQEDRLTNEMLTEHFYSPPIKDGKAVRGSLAIIPLFRDKFLKWVCFDLDNEEIVDKAKTLLTKLNELGIEYLEELGGDNLERRHIWIRVESSQTVAKEFFTALLMVIYNFKTKEEPFSGENFDEVFGVNKPRNLIRLPLGYHLKRDRRFPFFNQAGEESEDPVDFIKTWLGLSILSEERMLELIKLFDIKEAAPIKIKSSRVTGEKLHYFPRNLPMPMADIPSELMPVVKNCQAINKIIENVMENKQIEKAGGVYHNSGLLLAGVAAYNDAIRRAGTSKKITEGKKWFNELVKEYRTRDSESHVWDQAFKTAETNENRVFARCDTWRENFNLCEGCPFANKVSSPKEFIFGTRITKKQVRKVKLKTAEEIRETTFVEVKEYINKLLESGGSGNILLASPPGSGKSVLVDDISCSLSKRGFKCLIAVPTTDLAIEHKARLKECGVDSFILASHKAIFQKEISKFPCPSFEEIQKQINLGVSGTSVKESICSVCPHWETCYFPRQYQQVQEPEHNIVIIQHAHFSTPEIVFKLMEKRFDILFIDESFVKNCYKSEPIISNETELLKAFDFDWCTKLTRWLSTEDLMPVGELNPLQEELTRVKQLFDSSGMRWRVPDLIRYFNQKRKVNKYLGIEIIYEIPKVPLRVFTDALPPEELIKCVTDTEELKIFGKGEVLDYRRTHKDNKVIQILNNSTSVSSLSNEEKFDLILTKIADLVETEYINHKVLLTVYKKDFKRVEEFFERNIKDFPTARSRIVIDKMDKGTNKYSDFDVQFLLAGVYFTGAQTLLDSYKYKTVANYYNYKAGRPHINNIFPYDIEGYTNIPYYTCPIERIEPTKTGAAVFEYECFTTRFPKDSWDQYSYNYNVADTQQAARIRFLPDKSRILYIWNNLPLPSLLITDSVLFEDFVNS